MKGTLMVIVLIDFDKHIRDQQLRLGTSIRNR